MPVCPQCSANIHAGALYRCPVCGYSIARAEKLFGTGKVVFTRVVDAAGALTNTDLQDLMHYLANLERNLPPVALCVYITDLGNEKELRPHAHWILNHAGIHHPSFGKREDRKAIEDAAMQEDIREKGAPPREEQKTGFLHAAAEFWQTVKERVRNVVRPYAAPVKMEWTLILVLDVQQELACFSWGYRLDPYINPERINKAIISARLQFRERATAQGIKKVMRNAVRIIASDSRAVSRRIRKEGKVGKPVGVETMPEIPGVQRAMKLLLPAMLGLSLALSAPAAMAATTQKPAQRTAQKTTQKTAQRAKAPAKQAAKAPAKQTAKAAAPKKAARPAKAAPPAKRTASKTSSQSGAKKDKKPAEATKKATLKEGPETVREDKAPLIVPAKLPPATSAAPRLPDAPAAPGLVDDDTAEEVEEDVPEVDVEDTPPPAPVAVDAVPRWKPEDYTELMKGSLQTGYAALFPARGEAAAKRPASPNGKAAAVEESDTKVLGRYCPEYSKPSPHGLIDPQGLLSTMEREDVEHQLREINRNGKFRVYAAVAKAGQEMPGDLAVGTLATAAAQPCEYAVLMLYYIGSPSSLELGYQEIKADDAQRHEWLNKARAAAAECGTGTEGLMAALRQVAANVTPLAASFRPLTVDNTVKAPKLDIPFKEEEEAKEPGFKEKLAEKIQDPENASLLPYLGGAFLGIILFTLAWLYRRRHSPTLLDTTPDWRFYARYGSGVSRLVKYLEGKESEKEKTLF